MTQSSSVSVSLRLGEASYNVEIRSSYCRKFVYSLRNDGSDGVAESAKEIVDEKIVVEDSATVVCVSFNPR